MAEISAVYAAGFVTGGDGIANVTAKLNGGRLPAGAGVNFGWKNKSGLKKVTAKRLNFTWSCGPTVCPLRERAGLDFRPVTSTVAAPFVRISKQLYSIRYDQKRLI